MCPSHLHHAHQLGITSAASVTPSAPPLVLEILRDFGVSGTHRPAALWKLSGGDLVLIPYTVSLESMRHMHTFLLILLTW